MNNWLASMTRLDNPRVNISMTVCIVVVLDSFFNSATLMVVVA